MQNIDVRPLHELILPLEIADLEEDIDLSFFDVVESFPDYANGRWKYDGSHPDFSNINVYFNLSHDLMSANEDFQFECKRHWNTTEGFIFGGEGNNKYCVSYVKEDKLPVDALCLSTGYYHSFVIFQKGQLIITIWEESSDKESLIKEEVISYLAQKLKN
jgi:hypothetical protein